MKQPPFLLSSISLFFLLTPFFPLPFQNFSSALLFNELFVHKDSLLIADSTTVALPKETVHQEEMMMLPIAHDDTLIIRNTLPEMYNVLVNDYKGYDNKANQLSILRSPKGKLSIRRTDEVDMILYQANYSGEDADEFVYQICNDNGDCDSARVHIIKCPANHPAFPKRETIILKYGETKEFNYFGQLIYPSPSTRRRPLYGDVIMSADSSLLHYQPAEGFYGLDRLNFTVYEDWGYCGLYPYESVNNFIYVLPDDRKNNKPVAVTDQVTLKAHRMVKIKPLENDYDPEDTLEERIVSISLAKKGKVRYSSTTVTYMPDANFKKGKDELTYQICDYNGLCASGKIVIHLEEAIPPLTVED